MATGHPTYAFLVTLADEGVAQLESCLGLLRKSHPDAPVRVISDGVSDIAYPPACVRYQAEYTAGSYLKRLECGGLWWRRFFAIGLATGADWIIKLDPDACVHRPFRGLPPFPVSGTIEHAGQANESVQGGCQVIAAWAAKKLLESPLSDAWELRSEWTYCNGDDAMRRQIRSQSYLATDGSLAWMLRQAAIVQGDWPEIGSRWRYPPPRSGDFAISHPHKLMVPSDRADVDAPLRVICTCMGRLAHLKQTLPAWLAEPGVGVTVVDYGCPDLTADWLAANEPRADVVRVTGISGFRLARARNIGASHAPPGWWCFLDADCLLKTGWSATVRGVLRPRRYFLPAPIEWGQFGSVVVHSDDFKYAGGYDDLFVGWGAEDGDFYSRLRQVGVRPATFDGSIVSAITHSDAERTRNYEVKDKFSSQRVYDEYLRRKMIFMRASGRLPSVGECRNLLSEAHWKVGIPMPEWSRVDEPPPGIAFYPGTDAPG